MEVHLKHFSDNWRYSEQQHNEQLEKSAEESNQQQKELQSARTIETFTQQNSLFILKQSWENSRIEKGKLSRRVKGKCWKTFRSEFSVRETFKISFSRENL